MWNLIKENWNAWGRIFNRLFHKTIYIVCPDCTSECPSDKVWVYYLIYRDWMTGNCYTYITEKGKSFTFAGWTNLNLVGVDDICMDRINGHLLNKLVKTKERE